jgi:phage tail-like protein
VNEGFLNLDLGDPRLTALLDGVRLEHGALTLAPVHGAASRPGGETDVEAALAGVAGIGVDPDGNIYVADTDRDRIVRIPACGGEGQPVGCLELAGPRGVVVGPRRALYVADTLHHRVLVVDLATEQVRAVWGQRDGYADPVPGSDDGLLSSPWDLAADAHDRLYVVDQGNARVQRFDADGRVDAGFAAALAAASTVPRAPTYVVTILIEEEERLLVFDRSAARRSRLLVYDLDGTFHPGQTRRLRALLGVHAHELFSGPPGAIAASGSTLHVADLAARRVLSFDADGAFLGAARWNGLAAGLAVDEQGRLLIHPGTGEPARLELGPAASTGTFRLGPFAVSALHPRPTSWHKLSAKTDPLPAGAHLQLFTLATDDPAAPPPLDDPAWTPAAADAAELRLTAAPTSLLWIGGRLSAADAGGPVVRGLRIDFDGDGWLRYLPALYSREPSPFLAAALDLFEDALGEQEEKLESIPRLLDPASAPDLPWLAGWLAWELDETLSDPAKRESIRGAFRAQGLRGTAEGLRELVRAGLGADVRVVETATSLRVWELGADGAGLGFGTMLTAAEADGAVLGTTAELDHSHLLAEHELGSMLFAPAAHEYCVQVYAADLDGAAARAALERLVERERPAATEAHVCVIEPRARVGHQATVGVDAIVGRSSEPWILGGEPGLGERTALPDSSHPPTVGAVRVGRAATLT